jgi:hypothetical protein
MLVIIRGDAILMHAGLKEGVDMSFILERLSIGEGGSVLATWFSLCCPDS